MLAVTTIYICTHHELVGLNFRLGPNRRRAIDLAADRASRLLTSRGLNPVLSTSFADWHGSGKMHAMARVHNYFAVDHHELTAHVERSICDAAKVFIDTLVAAQQPAEGA